MTRPDWTKLSPSEKAAAVNQLIQPGMTLYKLAAKFENASRGAIMGLCRRANITLPNSRRAPGATVVRIPAQKTVKHDFGKMVHDPVPFIDALNSNRCKWPLWDKLEGPEVSMCCGLPRQDSHPYCIGHVELSKGVGTSSERSAHRSLKVHMYPPVAT